MARLLIASPYPAMRAGLRSLLTNVPGMNIVGESDSLNSTVEWAQSARPQVIVYDLALEVDDELSGLWRLRREAAGVSVLALAEPGTNGRMLAALQAGARGCLPKTASGAEIAEALTDIAAGQTIVPSAATAALLEQLRGDSTPVSLSPREADVLRGVAAGLTNKAIAIKLGISEHTVKFHLGGAMSKLSAASRAEAVATAIRRGLISV